MTATPLRGIKHTCASCMTRFFDFNKESPACPKCAHKVALIVRVPRKRRALSERHIELQSAEPWNVVASADAKQK